MADVVCHQYWSSKIKLVANAQSFWVITYRRQRHKKSWWFYLFSQPKSPIFENKFYSKNPMEEPWNSNQVKLDLKRNVKTKQCSKPQQTIKSFMTLKEFFKFFFDLGMELTWTKMIDNVLPKWTVLTLNSLTTQNIC